MFLAIVLLIVGLVLILGGADFMTKGAAAVARRMGMSEFLVGLTVVSMMTSAPELMVSVSSALHGATDMAVGNIVGSNVFNILVIIGVCAIIKPIRVTDTIMNNEIPLVILSALVLLIMGASPWLDGGPMVLTRVDGLLLLVFFVIFMRYTIRSARRPGAAPEADDAARPMPVAKALLCLVGGLAALIFGGNLFVDNAVVLAREMGWSEAMIGLTILAAGTSLPELATSAVAAARGMPGIALGNVIGSNIFNIFFVLGCTATSMPLSFGNVRLVDLTVLVGACVLFWCFGWLFGHREIRRWEGAVLVSLYVAYIAWLAAGAAAA